MFLPAAPEIRPYQGTGSELLDGITADRIEKIESGKSKPHPDEVLRMAAKYRSPALCNHFCSNVCEIGQKYIPPIEVKDLSQIVLEILATFNSLERMKNRLIDITADGVIDDNELDDFHSHTDRAGAYFP